MIQPLSGIKVLDLTRVVAGPLCTQMLCDSGATVYKIERPKTGDDTRAMGPFIDDRSADVNASSVFMAYNRGKKSLAIDFSQPKGAELVRKLAQQCDVVIENFKAGGLVKYGLDYESIKIHNPSVVYCSLSGFGQDGPYAQYPAYDFIMQGLAGLMSTCGQGDESPGGGPMRTAIPISDIVSGMTAAITLFGALFQRQRTGQGQYIDTSLLDAAVALNGHLALGYLLTGQGHQRVGNRNPIASPSELFDCADGQLIIAVGNDSQFLTLCKVLSAPELAEHELFKTNALRVQNRDALRARLDKLLKQYNGAELIDALRQQGVPAGPVNTMQDVFNDPQVQHRELMTTVHDPKYDTPLRLLNSPLRYEKGRVDPVAPPLLGEHTAQVLAQELNLEAEELQILIEHGIVDTVLEA